METKVFVIRTWDDLVFATRNREYGAYSLRQEYTKRLLIALGLSTSMIIVLLFLPRLFPESKIVPTVFEHPIGQIRLQIYDPPKKDIKSASIRESSQKNNKTDNTIRVVREEVTPPADDVSAPTDQTVSIGQGIGERTDQGTLTGVETQALLPAVSQGPMLVAEVMPSYAGGLEAMMKYIQKKIRYPSTARKQEIEGTVFVSFVVNGDGSVSDVTVIRGIHPDCDKEAVRVISLLPGWMGGKHNGNPVAVKMVLPITFSLKK